MHKWKTFSSTGLKPGRVIWVTFSPGQPGLTRIIKYLGLTRILHCISALIMASGSDQSDEFSVLDGDDVVNIF